MPISCNIGGVYHKGKPYVNIGGVWHKAKKVYVNVGGVWRQCYSSGIAISEVSAVGDVYFINSGGSSWAYSVTPSISVDSNGINLSAGFSARYITEEYLALCCRIKVPISTAYQNQNLLSIVGDITLGHSGNAYPEWLSAEIRSSSQQYIDSARIKDPAFLGANTINSMFAAGNITQPITYYQIEVAVVSENLSKGESGDISMYIPWSIFTWVPTGEKFIYQP